MMIFDYETLRIIWWAFLGFLIIGFAIMGGYDLGVGILLPFLGKNDDERRVILNSIGSTWEGNQVWFVMAGGALFAAWPTVYAVTFSSFYFALLFALFALFLRPLGFDYRSKVATPLWRENWDRALFVGGFVPSLVLGIAFGNLLKGIPFYFESDMRIIYSGTFWGLLNPFALLTGLLSLSMFTMHGAIYLQIKTIDSINRRAKKAVLIFTIATLVLFALGGLWVVNLDGYHITSEVLTNGASNPLTKFVKREPGLWLDNYGHLPGLWAIPIATFISGIIALVLSRADKPGTAFVFSSVTIATIILTTACSMFPFLIPSSLSLNSSLTVWDASSSIKTLSVMFWATVIFLPLIIVYTSWVFRVLRGKVTVDHIRKNNHTLY
ncbi:MAG: cytochrome d ubiquinol oxidase subunit II [Methylococcales bacterium]